MLRRRKYPRSTSKKQRCTRLTAVYFDDPEHCASAVILLVARQEGSDTLCQRTIRWVDRYLPGSTDQSVRNRRNVTLGVFDPWNTCYAHRVSSQTSLRTTVHHDATSHLSEAHSCGVNAKCLASTNVTIQQLPSACLPSI